MGSLEEFCEFPDETFRQTFPTWQDKTSILFFAYSVLHNKPELPFFAKLVCTALFGPKMEIQPLLQRFNQR